MQADSLKSWAFRDLISFMGAHEKLPNAKYSKAAHCARCTGTHHVSAGPAALGKQGCSRSRQRRTHLQLKALLGAHEGAGHDARIQDEAVDAALIGCDVA